jgi:hypothetical protein
MVRWNAGVVTKVIRDTREWRSRMHALRAMRRFRGPVTDPRSKIAEPVKAATMLYPELFKQLEAVRWDMDKDIPWDRSTPSCSPTSRRRRSR